MPFARSLKRSAKRNFKRFSKSVKKFTPNKRSFGKLKNKLSLRAKKIGTSFTEGAIARGKKLKTLTSEVSGAALDQVKKTAKKHKGKLIAGAVAASAITYKAVSNSNDQMECKELCKQENEEGMGLFEESLDDCYGACEDEHPVDAIGIVSELTTDVADVTGVTRVFGGVRSLVLYMVAGGVGLYILQQILKGAIQSMFRPRITTQPPPSLVYEPPPPPPPKMVPRDMIPPAQLQYARI